MADLDISLGKDSPRDKTFHFNNISQIENGFRLKGYERSVAYYQASRELDAATFKQLTNDLKCAPATRTKYVKGGEFFCTLTEDQRQLMPKAATTLYAIALASPELREKAFQANKITKDLKREDWNAWVRESRAAAGAKRMLFRVEEPGGEAEKALLLESAKKWALENSAAIKIPNSNSKKNRQSVKAATILSMAAMGKTLEDVITEMKLVA